MACVVNPDGTISCDDTSGTLSAEAVGFIQRANSLTNTTVGSNAPTAQASKANAEITKNDGQQRYVLIFTASELPGV